jgi:hypothetical protein
MVIAVVLLIGAGALVALRVRVLARRRRRMPPEELELAALTRLLARIGSPVPPRLTLRQLELRLAHTAGPEATGYVRMLRERRFAQPGAHPLEASGRRELWRALTRGRGPWTRLAAYAAVAELPFRRG